MSWLSQGLNDVGLSGVNTFFNSAIKPALENPIVDVGLGLGAAALTGGLLAPEIGAGLTGLFGAGDAAAASAPLDITAGADLGAASADASGATALGFSGDVAAGGSTIPDFPTLASDSALAGNVTPTAGLPGLGSGGSAAPAFGSDAGFGGPPAFASTGATAPDASGGFLTLDGSTSPVAAGDITNAPAAGADSSNILSQLASKAGSAISANPLQSAAAGLGVAGLGYNLVSGYQQKQAINRLTAAENTQAATAQTEANNAFNAAQPELAQGQILQEYLSTGTLPQAIQSQVTQQTAAAKAQIIQGYGSRGMSTDPNQNSALAQDLANVDTQAQTLMGNLETQLNTAGTQMVQQANSLLQSGVQATNIASQIPIAMQNLNIRLGAATSQAIASFAAALNSGNKVTLNVQSNQQAA
jgi:hypothetical protein